MLPISINLSDVASEFSLDKRQTENMIEYVIKEITALTAKNWDTQAKNTLRASRGEYRRSLIVVDKGRFEGQIILRGVVPNMIEQGAEAFDMKVGFANSSKVKHNKKGEWYLTIPFRYANPDALGESEAFAGVMPTEVYSVAKSNKGAPVKDSQLPEEFQIPTTRKAVTIKSTLFETYKSQTSIYSGLSRDSKTYDKANQGTYHNFRKVGENSDPNMFIHTGIIARNLAEKAIQDTNVPETIDRLTDNYLASLGF